MAYKFARCVQFRLAELTDNQLIFTGNVTRPNATAAEWGEFKRQVNQKRYDHNRNPIGEQFSIEWAAVQHITANLHSDTQADDCHFDFIFIVTIPKGSDSAKICELARQTILRWFDAASEKAFGGSCRRSCVPKPNRRLSDLEAIANYLCKYDPSPDKQCYLPVRRGQAGYLPVTWPTKGFWGRDKRRVEIADEYENGEEILGFRNQSPYQQIWSEWISSWRQGPMVTADPQWVEWQRKELLANMIVGSGAVGPNDIDALLDRIERLTDSDE